MTGFIAHSYSFLLLVTNRYMTRFVFSSPSYSTAISRDSTNSDSSRPVILVIYTRVGHNRKHVDIYV
jgi:hypothetical protein